MSAKAAEPAEGLSPSIAEALSSLTVQQPVCPTCLRVGKQPVYSGQKNFCMGQASDGTQHKRIRMQAVRFRAMPLGEQEQASAA